MNKDKQMTEQNSVPKKSSNHFWMIFLAGIGAFNLALVVMFFSVIIAAVSGSGDISFGELSDEDSDAPQIGVIEVTEEIKSAKKTVEQLYRFRDNEDIKAIVLRIESPGGGASASQEIYNAVRDVAKTKKVVASMGSLAASGGYYIACGANTIYALPSTVTASIGVIAVTTEVKDLIEWMKMKPHVYKSGKFKDMLSPLRSPSLEDEELIMALINDIYEQFVKDVLAGRPNLEEAKLRSIADGRVMTGAQAKALGLIDEFGGLHEAARAALTLAGVQSKEDPRLVYPKRKTEDMLEAFFADTMASAGDKFVRQQAKNPYNLQMLWPGSLRDAMKPGN